MGVAANIGVGGWSTYGKRLPSRWVPVLPTISHMLQGRPASYTALTQTSGPGHGWRQADHSIQGGTQGRSRTRELEIEPLRYGRETPQPFIPPRSSPRTRRCVPRTERSPSWVMAPLSKHKAKYTLKLSWFC
jgi:hypothetical protein